MTKFLELDIECEGLRHSNLTILEGYGITECSPIVAATPESDPRPGTIGRIMPSMEYVIVDPESNKSIARRLDISVHTAKFHVAAVLAKLGARNRSDAVAIGMRRGLVLL